MNVYATPGPGAGDVVIFGLAAILVVAWMLRKLRKE